MTKRQRFFRILLSLTLAAVILALAGIVVLRSRAFNRYVLAEIAERASQATGGRVEIGSFRVHWSGLRVDLGHIVLFGAEGTSQQPLLRVDRLTVGLKILSFWQGKVALREIIIDHPSVHMTLDQNGRTNLPQPPPRRPGTQSTNVFALAVGRLVVNRGELDCNDRSIPLNAEVHDLSVQVGFESLKPAYDGTLAYSDGRVQVGSFNPVPHGLQARFSATPVGLTLNSLALNAGSSTISAQARLQDYHQPSVEAAYQADISTRELGNILKVPEIPAGQVSLQGTFHYQYRAGQPFLHGLALAGRFRSPALALNLPQARAGIRAITGEYRMSDGTLAARNVRAQVLGGRVSGNLTLTHLSERPVARVAASVSDVSLQAAGAAIGTHQIQHADITGKLNGTVQVSWEGSGRNLLLRSDATLTASAPVQEGPETAANAIPLQGALHLCYNGQSSAVSLSRTEFTTPHTTVKLDGSTGKQSSLNIQAQSDDLREVDQLALIVRHAFGGSRESSPTTVQPFGVSGSGSFEGQLHGSMANLQLTGQLSGTQLEYQGVALSELRVNVALSPSDVTLSQGEIQTGDHGQARFNLSAGLTDWAYTPQSPIGLDLRAERIPAAAIERMANLPYPVTGTLGARVSLHGSQSNLLGQGSATLSQAVVWGQPLQNLSVQFQGAGSTVKSTVQVQTVAGSGSGQLTYDFRNQGYNAQFHTSNLQLEKLDALSRGNVQVTGAATASLQGQGTLKAPQLAAAVQAAKLVIGEQTLEGVKVQVNVAQQKATLTLETSAQGASIRGQANVNLAGDDDATASIDVRNIQLGNVLAAFLPEAPLGLHGQAELHGTLHGPLKQREQIEAEVDIPTLSLAYQSLRIGNASPIHAAYKGGVFTLDPVTLKGTGTDLQLQASVPLKGARNLQAQAVGTIDLHLIQLLYPQWDSSGQLRLDVGAEGALTRPNLHGTVKVIDAFLQPPGALLGAQKLNAALAIQNGRVDIQSFTGEAGGGTLSVQGFATFQPVVRFNLQLAAKEVRLRYPVGTRTVLDSTLLLTGSPDAALLSGQVSVQRVSFTKAFDLSNFADQFSGSSAASSGPGFAQNVKLNVSLTSASNMALANSQLSLQGSANLMVRGTAAEPVILGRTDITEGEVFFNGNRYKVESGLVEFVNPLQTEPVLDLIATTTVNQFDISLNVSGPIDRLRVSYTSDPPLAPIDIINLIATGQTTEAASTTATTPQSVIAGQLASQFSNRVQKLAGISSLTIDPQVGGTQGNGIARLGIQQRVTKNLYFSFSTDLTNSAAQVVQVEYQLTRKYAISTMRDQNGIYTLQIKMHKRF